VRALGWWERRGISTGASSAMATMTAVWAGDRGPWWLFRAIFSRRPSLHPVFGPNRADRRYRLPLERAFYRPNAIFFLVVCRSTAPLAPLRLVESPPRHRALEPPSQHRQPLPVPPPEHLHRWSRHPKPRAWLKKKKSDGSHAHRESEG
jgi:hypothetical protein